MPVEKIHMSDVVRVTLNHHGVKIIRAYYESECARRGVDSMLEDLAEQKAPYRVTLRPRLISMWELFKIFGPHFITGDRHPFDSIELDRSNSESEDAYKRMHERSDRLEGRLRCLAELLGIRRNLLGELIEKIDQYQADPPSRTPDRAGQWWLNARVVTVETGAKSTLVAVLSNGRRKPIDELEGWAGPALRDFRLRDQDDEDIPF